MHLSKKLSQWLRSAVLRYQRGICMRIGRNGETAAADYLANAGYDILARNWRAPHGVGELDVVARDANGCLCFVEVKTRRERNGRAPLIAPIAAVDAGKRDNLRKAARCWQNAMSVDPKPRYRFDVIEVWSHNSSPVRLKHWPYAFASAETQRDN